MPNILAAFGASPPRKSSTRVGNTGTIKPSASMSSVTVMKIKTTAALRGFMWANWRGILGAFRELDNNVRKSRAGARIVIAHAISV
jgi:hypothetical protein